MNVESIIAAFLVGLAEGIRPRINELLPALDPAEVARVRGRYPFLADR